MQPASRQELIDYCLRKLGQPVIKVNVSESQLDDRVDDALIHFADFHFNGVERVYLKHQLTSTDITNQYLVIPEAVTSIIEVFRFGGFGTTKGNIFDFRYQYALNDMYTFGNMTSMVGYVMTRNHLDLIEFLFNSKKAVRFNRHMQKLFIDMSWTADVQVGDFLVITAYRVLDPEKYTSVFNDDFLKRYLTAIIKKQWGENLKKMGNIQLPGAVILNGKEIYDEAVTEIADLEKELETKWSDPVDFFMG